MIESAILRAEGGSQLLTRVLAKLLPYPPPELHSPPPAAAAAADVLSSARIGSTSTLLSFLRASGVRVGSSFASEWIHSAKPPPTLRANFAFNRAHSRVELVLVQPPPSEAAQLGEIPLTIGWGEPDGADGGLSRATVPPIKLQPVERHSGSSRSQLVEIVVTSVRRRRLKRPRAEGGGDGELEAGGFSAGLQPWQQLPLLWVRLDPSLELPIRVVWSGRDEAMWSGMPEDMCTAQLLVDHDVASRESAALALSTFHTVTAIDTLAGVICDTTAYFRVRKAAAIALGRLVHPSTQYAAVDRLVDVVRELYYEDGYLRPNDFSALADYEVLKALVEALGTCRDARGQTPLAAFELLNELLDANDNSANEFDDGFYLSCLLRALAATNCAQAGSERLVVAQITRHLRLDALLGSHDAVLSRSALQALCALELHRAARPSHDHRP